MSKKKSPAGRKRVSEPEKVVPVTIYVKRKFKPQVLAACAAIAAKYR